MAYIEAVDDVQTVVDAVLVDTTEDGHLETRLDAYIKKEVDDVQTVVDAELADTEADGHLQTSFLHQEEVDDVQTSR